jgi:SSS family solute:Na+ symporter
LAFVIRIWIVFMACLVVGVIASRLAGPAPAERIIDLGEMHFATTSGFNRSAFAVVVVLIAIYGFLW